MSLITVFDPWNSKICTCPAKYSLSAYTGCGHGCLYCYASSYIINFSSPRPKKDFLKRLEKEIKKLPPHSLITIANSSDPYTPQEEKLKLTRKTLQMLQAYDFKILLVTKSDMVLRDIDILKDLKNIVLTFTLTTLDKTLSAKLEPGAPAPGKRLKAMEKLSPYIPLACRFDPLIYPLNSKEIPQAVKTLKKAGVKQIITSTYKVKPDNFKRMASVFPGHKQLWQKLYFEQGEKKQRYIYLAKKLREELIGKVEKAALKEKLEFSSCREGFKQLNTKNCDGSSLF